MGGQTRKHVVSTTCAVLPVAREFSGLAVQLLRNRSKTRCLFLECSRCCGGWGVGDHAGGVGPNDRPGHTASVRRRKEKEESARRPVSRVLSASCDAGRSFLWDTHRCVPRATNPGGEAKDLRTWPASRRSRTRPAAPIRSCSRWGLPCRRRCRKRGALLPHRFTLACRLVRSPGRAGGLFSVALSLGSPPPAISRHRSFVEPGLSSTLPGATLAGSSGAAATVRPSGGADPGAGTGRRQAASATGRCRGG